MSEKYWYLIIGIIIGWITKVPFLIKWYRELRKTKEYKKMQDKIHFEEMKERYRTLYQEDYKTY